VPSRKKIHRARRQTLAMLADAEAALAKRETALAEKLVRRALEAGFMNARVHAEAAALLAALGCRGEAEAAARRAHELAPTAPFALEALAALGLQPLPAAPQDAVAPPEAESREALASDRSTRLDVGAAADALVRTGIAVAPEWLSAAEVGALASLSLKSAEFALAFPLASATGTLESAVWREGASPWFDAMVAETYARAADLANALAEVLGQAARFPLAPPVAPTVDRARWLRLVDGATYDRPPDPGGRSAFPLRACIALGPAPLTVALVDLRPGKRRERPIEVPAGAVAFFCARERCVAVGGVMGLQPVGWQLRSTGTAAAALLTWTDVFAT
jgi:hypothetical protein